MAVKETIRSVATQLREEILNSTRRELPDNCTAEDLMMGERDYVPELLTCLLESFICGDVSHLSQKACENKKNKKELSIFSIGQDLIYAAFGHKIKTSKHITLGLAVKSLGKKTELTFSTVNSAHGCPEDIPHRPDLNTGVAFDNFDRFVETLNGKDTLHDTVGIIFQDIVQNPDPVSVESSSPCVHENSTIDELVVFLNYPLPPQKQKNENAGLLKKLLLKCIHLPRN
ncbi:hypothetical protein JTB14_011344 [Gonioctena quinquepunctata]|nr:hypothetical protein JTB14_011344 [Gonioctena quinquepunctata]